MLKQKILFCAITLVLGLSQATAQVPQRKNIDLLTVDELAAYVHAIRILKDRSDTNPYDRQGYLWQAWIHNCPFIWQPSSGAGPKGSHDETCDDAGFAPGPGFVETFPGVCEHHKDLFLVWHRAEFYYFEKILQAADPDGTITDSRGVTGPSTRNVAIPFWNWTRPPSGKRYPTAFEDTNSVLYHDSRIHTTLTPEERTFLEKVTSPTAIAALVYEADWKTFGGYTQEAPIGGPGLFESAHHDLMHSSYFGGDMKYPRLAALDPGFFSFHAYIDLIFQFWLDRHGSGSVTSLDHFLRATQPGTIAPPPGHAPGAGMTSMGPASIYLDARKLGYGYEVTAADMLPSPETVAAVLAGPDGTPALFAETAKSRHARLSGDGLFDPRAAPPTTIATIGVQIPPTAGEIQVSFQRPHDAVDVSFSVDFFLHPAAIALDLTSKADREKYIVASLGHMGGTGTSDHGAHGSDKPLFVDLTTPVRDLAAAGHKGETWTLTAVVSGLAPSPTFGALSLVH